MKPDNIGDKRRILSSPRCPGPPSVNVEQRGPTNTPNVTPAATTNVAAVPSPSAAAPARSSLMIEIATSPAVPNTNNRQSSNKSEYYRLLLFLFGLMGVSSFYLWDAIVSCLYSLERDLFINQSDLSDSLIPVFDTTALLATIVVSLIGTLKVQWIYAGGLLLALAALMWCITCQIAALTIDSAIGIMINGWLIGMLYVAMGIGGLASGALQSSTYAFAVCCSNVNLAGWVSLGMGIGGVVAPAIWSILLLVGDGDPESLVEAVWIHVGFAALMSLAACVAGYWALIYIPILKTGNPTTRRLTPKTENNRPDEIALLLLTDKSPRSLVRRSHERSQTYFSSISFKCLLLKDIVQSRYHRFLSHNDKPNSTWQCFLKSWRWQLHCLFCAGVTFAIFPNMAPYGFHEGVQQAGVAAAAFQVSDLIGRYIPNMPFRWAVIPKERLKFMNILRGSLFGLAVLTVYFTSNEVAFFDSFIYQCLFCIVLGLTNGWFMTQLMLTLPDAVDVREQKAKVSSIGTIGINVSAVAGMWICDFIKAALAV